MCPEQLHESIHVKVWVHVRTDPGPGGRNDKHTLLILRVSALRVGTCMCLGIQNWVLCLARIGVSEPRLHEVMYCGKGEPCPKHLGLIKHVILN